MLLHHLNAARSCLVDRAERLDLVELNCAASNQALQSGAWMIAGSHAQIAVELLDGRERELSPDLAFRASSRARSWAVTRQINARHEPPIALR